MAPVFRIVLRDVPTLVRTSSSPLLISIYVGMLDWNSNGCVPIPQGYRYLSRVSPSLISLGQRGGVLLRIQNLNDLLSLPPSLPPCLPYRTLSATTWRLPSAPSFRSTPASPRATSCCSSPGRRRSRTPAARSPRRSSRWGTRFVGGGGGDKGQGAGKRGRGEMGC